METYKSLDPNRSHSHLRQPLSNLSVLLFTQVPLPLMNGPFETSSQEDMIDVASLGVVTTRTAKEAWDSIQTEWGKSTDMRQSHAQEALN